MQSPKLAALCYGLMKRANFPSTPLRLRMPAPVLELTIICMKYRCVRRQYNSSKCKECVWKKEERSIQKLTTGFTTDLFFFRLCSWVCKQFCYLINWNVNITGWTGKRTSWISIARRATSIGKTKSVLVSTIWYGVLCLQSHIWKMSNTETEVTLV